MLGLRNQVFLSLAMMIPMIGTVRADTLILGNTYYFGKVVEFKVDSIIFDFDCSGITREIQISQVEEISVNGRCEINDVRGDIGGFGYFPFETFCPQVERRYRGRNLPKAAHILDLEIRDVGVSYYFLDDFEFRDGSVFGRDGRRIYEFRDLLNRGGAFRITSVTREYLVIHKETCDAFMRGTPAPLVLE